MGRLVDVRGGAALVSMILATAACGAEPGFRVQGGGTGVPKASRAADEPVSRAEAAPVERRSSGSPDRSSGILWRFRAGAPVTAPPLVLPDGSVYVATTEGLVHALSGAGAFRFSHNLEGPARLGVTAHPAGFVLAATQTGTLHAIRPDGTAVWVYRAHVPITTAVTVDEGGVAYFGGRDDHVHAVSPRGGGRWRAPAYNTITAGPIVDRRGRIVVATATPKLVFMEGVLRRASVRLGEPALTELVADGDDVLVVVGDTLVRFDSAARPTEIARARFAATPHARGFVVVATDDALLWLDRRFEQVARVELRYVPADRPTVLEDGRAVVATDDGWVLFVDPKRGVVRRVRVASAALHRAVVDPTGERLVVVAGDGSVAAISTEPRAGIRR